ncbi:Ribonuclease H superfamily protein [Trifolium repens]|nr:Ribonuclease H superfamily protein [Trifolium repens]
MMNSFWWGGGNDNKGIKWLAWDRMTYPKALGGMGFRELHSFNLAMIAKQGWNIMTKPHTLVARLYKARYFPNSSLFDSQIGHNPSYAWRGIWKARQVLMNGCRWSIRNGTSIKIMKEPWLRGKEGAWVPSPQIQGAFELTVNDLLQPNGIEWDKEKIVSLFPMHVVNCITDIPLFELSEQDKLVWMDDVHGQYNVKSGYNLLLKCTGKLDGAIHQEKWTKLWSIHAPPKTKHLLWRICKGCLPTRIRLQEKHVPCSTNCPLCDHDSENDWHILFSCFDSVQARHFAGLDHIITNRMQQHNNVKDVILDICANEDANTDGQFAVLAWMLWNNRNNAVWNNEKETGRCIGVKARQHWNEWYLVQNLQQNTTETAHQQHQTTWQPPPFNWYKCNVDAGFHQEVNKTSAGWCVRDYRGHYVMAGTSWKDGQCSILEGEAMALLHAMRELEQRGLSQVIFETDSKSVVDAIQHFRGGNSEFSSIISQINNVLLFNPNFMVKFIKRQANMVAHKLARAAIAWSSRYIMNTLPVCIATILNNEMN